MNYLYANDVLMYNIIYCIMCWCMYMNYDVIMQGGKYLKLHTFQW